jgi:hypothetical protein
MSTPENACITVSFPSGVADPIRNATSPIGTVKAIVCPRQRLSELAKALFYKRPGVYVLLGKDKIYVGEAERVGPRVEQHKADFWKAVAFFTAGDQLNKVHAKHLEADLVALGLAAKRCDMENDKQPRLPQLSAHDQAVTAGFLKQILQLMTALGIPYFEESVQPHKQAAAVKSTRAPAATVPIPDGEVQVHYKGLVARGRALAKGFLVLAGSAAAKATQPKIAPQALKKRHELIAAGLLVDAGEHYVLVQDHIFHSATVAAGVMIGRSAQATFWTDGKGLRGAAAAKTKAAGASA